MAAEPTEDDGIPSPAARHSEASGEAKTTATKSNKLCGLMSIDPLLVCDRMLVGGQMQRKQRQRDKSEYTPHMVYGASDTKHEKPPRRIINEK